jgi:uncharacterized protein YbjQ (UPF0145 family)
MIVVTTNEINGAKVVRTLGTAFGNVVRSRGIGGNIAAGFRSLGGGEITEYTRLVEEGRMQAMQRLMANAHAMGANAVLAVRFDSGEIAQSMNEVVAYGTAVIIEPDGTA